MALTTVERAASTFVQAFLGFVVVYGDSRATVSAAAIAAGLAALRVLSVAVAPAPVGAMATALSARLAGRAAFWANLGERAVWTFVQTFAASVVVTGFSTSSFAAAGVAAGVLAVKAVCTGLSSLVLGANVVATARSHVTEDSA